MRNRVKPKIHIQRILLLCLVAFFYFVASCYLLDPPDIPCSVNITSPENGTSFKEGENISFSSIVKHFTDHPDNKWEYLAKISMVKWVSDKDGEIMTQVYDPDKMRVLHSFRSDSLSVNIHEIECITFYKSGDSYDFQCSDSILININEDPSVTTTTTTADTSTTTTMIDLSLFNHVKITLRTIKENRTSSDPPVEDRSTDVLSDFGHEGIFSDFDYYADWIDPPGSVTTVEHSGSISVTLSSVENAVTYVEYHREEDDLDPDSVYNYTIDLETVEDAEIPLINSSTTSLIFRVTGFEVCDYVAFYETIKVMNQTVIITRTHRFCDENSLLEIYFFQ